MKILYGVPGEGMGHATRSKVIIEHLLQHHDVQVVSSDRAYQFLSEAFPGRVHEIKGFHMAYRNAAVSRLRTVALTLRSAPENVRVSFHRYRSLQSFRPDLVISDFESFSYFYARYYKLPIISVDNMQVLSRCTLGLALPPEQRSHFAVAKGIVRAKLPGCDHYLITSFFNVPVCKENTTLVPPIIREQILRAQVRQGSHVLVYQSFASKKDLVQVLQQVPEVSFRVYGYNRSEAHGNVQLMPFSEQGFIDDLASARAVVANGGFSLLSEAVYLHKPICSVPIAGQFEQYLNAAFIEQLGYGRHFAALSADALKAFLYDLPRFAQNLSQYGQTGNEQLFATLQQVMEQVLAPAGNTTGRSPGKEAGGK